jgi:hypothetical protein
MKYYYLENKHYENSQWLVFKTKDALIDYLVYQKIGDEWRKEK